MSLDLCTALSSSQVNMDNTIVVLAGSSLFKYAAFLYLTKKRRSKYQKVGAVSELYIYPVKSCKGIKVDSLRCTKLGVEYEGVRDRYCMYTIIMFLLLIRHHA